MSIIYWGEKTEKLAIPVHHPKLPVFLLKKKEGRRKGKKVKKRKRKKRKQ